MISSPSMSWLKPKSSMLKIVNSRRWHSAPSQIPWNLYSTMYFTKKTYYWKRAHLRKNSITKRTKLVIDSMAPQTVNSFLWESREQPNRINMVYSLVHLRVSKSLVNCLHNCTHVKAASRFNCSIPGYYIINGLDKICSPLVVNLLYSFVLVSRQL